MTTNQSLRWLEVRLFYISHEIMDWNSNMLDVEDLIYKLADLGKYDARILLSATIELFQSSWLQPCRDEVICLSQLARLPRKQLDKMIKISDRVLYGIMDRVMQMQGQIRPYLAREAHPEIKKFLETLQKVRGLGVW